MKSKDSLEGNIKIKKEKAVPHKLQGSWAKDLDFQRSTAKPDPLNNQEYLSLYAF